jgi:RimJ/RimL family protein N-acetyltransferase
MIGNFGLFNYLVGIDDLSAPELDRGKKKWEISYDLDPNHWGQGLGKGIIGFLVSMGSWMGANVLTAVSPILWLTGC